MLHLILGRSGSGKTQYIRSLLRDLAKQGARDMILLVPEQFSFESERSMLELLGPRDAQRVEILSFSRLVDAVFRVYGGVSGTHIDDGGRMLLMSLALEAAQEHLDIYFKHRESPALAAKLLDLVAECRQCAVTPAELQAAADKLPDSVLRRKSRELALILDLYDTLVARSFIDDQDDLTRLNDTLLDHPFFHGRIVAIDAFKSFTVQEQRILSRILAQAQEVYSNALQRILWRIHKAGGAFLPCSSCTARRVTAWLNSRMCRWLLQSYWPSNAGSAQRCSVIWSRRCFIRKQARFPMKQRIYFYVRRRTKPRSVILWRARQSA